MSVIADTQHMFNKFEMDIVFQKPRCGLISPATDIKQFIFSACL